jgi:chromosome partitioning protein
VAAHSPETLAKLLPKVLLRTAIAGIDLLPAHMALATLDGAIGQQAGKGLMLRKILACLSQENAADIVKHKSTAYDYVVIDCQPVLGVLMVNALLAANVILLPTQTEHLGLHGLDRMLSTIAQMKQSLLPNVLTLVVPTMFDRRVKACVEAYAKMRDKYKAILWRGYIPTDTKFREASVKGLPICKVAPSAKGNFAYEKLTMELLKHD